MTRNEALATALELWQALRFPKDPLRVLAAWSAALAELDPTADEIRIVAERILRLEEEFPAPATFARRLGDLRREDPLVHLPGLPPMRRSEAAALRRDPAREALAPTDARKRLAAAFARLEGKPHGGDR
ncbi:MAG: hypothetical protein KIS66_13715 [Fimbriimonadaceae bacterium]|nr:hypothetical protein [Fimbriimonadaceae bacterium]